VLDPATGARRGDRLSLGTITLKLPDETDGAESEDSSP